MPIELNPGAQKAFVEADDLYSAYIGGLGSGKTYGGLARALRFAMQPRSGFHGPRGVIAAESYPVLNDVVIPQFAEMYYDLGIGDWDRDYGSQARKLTLPNHGEVLFRSLDRPDKLRGVELAWFYIDEGRNVPPGSWKILTGRLRQQGYKRGGWVCSTPFGYDWMYDTFHPDSDKREDGAVWYGAPTQENLKLPPEYVKNLEKSYHGRFYEQEVLGRFVGVMEGGVFPDYDERVHRVEGLAYDPALPLYTFWDFGIGDPGVVLFCQVDWREERDVDSEETVRVPVFKFLYEICEKDWVAAEWADAWKKTLRERFQGKTPRASFGDPAGKNRNGVTGTSMIGDLAANDVPVTAAPKKPQDYSIRILGNMIAGDRVLVSAEGCPQLSRAFVSHHWNMVEGQRQGINPVHDWTSHYIDAARYGAASLVSFFPRPNSHQAHEPFTPQQYGYVFQQLMSRNPDRWINNPGKARPTFDPRASDSRERTA